MWAVHVNNPFTSQRRIREREERVLDDAARDREQREALRQAAWGNASRSTDMQRDMERMTRAGPARSKASLAERAKYQFEADSEDEAMEDEIEQNLDMLHGAAKRLGHVARGMGREVDIQNKHLDRIGGKVCCSLDLAVASGPC
jgi:protein transport protein SEC9